MADTKIVVIFHTHNKSDFLIECIESFYHYNDPKDFYKLYLVDDYSTEDQDYSVYDYAASDYVDKMFQFSNPKERKAGVPYVLDKGIELLHRNDKQLGCTRTYDLALRKLVDLPEDTLVMYIQNDCFFMRALPVACVRALFTQYNAWFLRLWGEQRNCIRDAVSEKYKSLVSSLPVVEGEFVHLGGPTVYVHQPHVSLLSYEQRLLRGAKNEDKIQLRSKKLGTDKISAKFAVNVTNHIGCKTPFGRYGKGAKDIKHTRVGKDIQKRLAKHTS